MIKTLKDLKKKYKKPLVAAKNTAISAKKQLKARLKGAMKGY